MTRNQQILALRGKKSMGLIAKELGVTRAVVAGVFFRHDNDLCDLTRSPGGKGPNKKGWGRHGGAHAYASETMRDPRGR